MYGSRLLSLKICFLAVVTLVVMSFIPESLYSQTDSQITQPTQTQPSSSTIQYAPKHRYTTSLPSPSKKQQQTPTEPVSNEGSFEDYSVKRPSIITEAFFLALLSLFPFIIMILTSFLKIVVVLSLLRTALGVQNAPPNQVINGVGFLLSLFIMYPTGIKMYDAAQSVIVRSGVPDSITDKNSTAFVLEIANAAVEPMKEFLKRNSSTRHQAIFFKLAYRGLPEEYRDRLKPGDLMVLVPAYITGQLKDAFEIGVLIYIPFFVIDLVTSNILLAMGMMMLSPVTISMPLKLFLLVMLDGWTLLIEGLVKTFI